MKEDKTQVYPNISQSFGIVGIIILSMLVFIPVIIIGDKYIGEDIAFLIYSILTMGVPFLIVKHKKEKKNKLDNKSFDLTFGSYKIVGLIIMTLIAIQIGFIIPIVFSLPTPEFIEKIFMEIAGPNSIFSFISIVIAAPILEELIFRGIILDGLLKKYSPVKSIMISSFLFGIVHLNPWQFIGAMIIGIFSGWIYYKTGKLSLSIIIHMVNNGLAFLGVALTNPEDMINEQLIDTYGGGFPVFIIVTFGAIIIATTGILSLKTNLKSKDTHNKT
jgi:membrane protease YdiL (CAAX protease family)